MSMENARTVLLADPDEKRRTAHRKMLRGSGFGVLESGTVFDTLSILERSPVNLLVSWQGFPDGSGVEMCLYAGDEKRIGHLRIMMVTERELPDTTWRKLCSCTQLVCRRLSSTDLLKEAYRLTGLYEERRALERALDEAREVRRSRPVR